jgi:cytoskeletal protein RodZ
MQEDSKMTRTAGTPRMDQSQMMYHEKRNSMMPWMALVAVVVVLGAVGFLFRDKLFASKNVSTDKNTQVMAKSSGYQAVFLSNGQVYFGKMSDVNSSYVTLSDIYYLQVTQPPLQGSQQSQSTTPQAQPQLSLVKLGNELHGPVDEMKINRDQILFFEDMKEDAKVMEAIKEYKANPNAGQSTAPATTAPSTTNPNK